MRAALLLVLALGAVAAAHEVRPGYLQLTEIAPNLFEVLWKVPARGDERFGIRPVLPRHCRMAEPVGAWTGEAYVERRRVDCPGGIDGHQIAIEGLTATMTDVLVRLARANGSTQTVRLTPAAPSSTVEAAPGRLDVATTYLWLGVEHILRGFDHLLFVLGLLMLVGGGRRLVATVTAFTVAHSVTLAAATVGFVHVPQKPVEAAIALSIVFVAVEVVRAHEGRPGVANRWPWVVALVFGLLHGLGFAGALAEVGLPAHAIPLALLLFNVGVELGQLAFIAAVLGAMALVRRAGASWPPWGWRIPTYAVGALAAYWTIERVVAF